MNEKDRKTINELAAENLELRAENEKLTTTIEGIREIVLTDKVAICCYEKDPTKRKFMCIRCHVRSQLPTKEKEQNQNGN